MQAYLHTQAEVIPISLCDVGQIQMYEIIFSTSQVHVCQHVLHCVFIWVFQRYLHKVPPTHTHTHFSTSMACYSTHLQVCCLDCFPPIKTNTQTSRSDFIALESCRHFYTLHMNRSSQESIFYYYYYLFKV